MTISEKFYLSHAVFGEREVSRSQYIAAERAAGFTPASGNDDELATNNFESEGITGRVETVTDPDLSETIQSINKLDLVPGNMVLIRTVEGVTPESINQMVATIRPLIPETCPVAVLQGSADISQMTDESMLGQGWVRVPELPEWEFLSAISESDAVDTAIRNVIEDTTYDNGVFLVREILTAFIAELKVVPVAAKDGGE